MKKKNIILLLVTLLFSCDAITGEEIARLPINEITKSDENMIIKEASINLKKGDQIAIWSDMDFSYEGEVALLFRFEILRDEESLGGFEIDPTDKNLTIGEVKTSILGKTDWSFTGKNSEYDIEKDGIYTFRAILIASENSTPEVEKAEVVFKK